MTQDSIAFIEQIKIKYDVDIFIAGGGPAGIAAALAASKTNTKIYLAEGQNCFGGMGTSGLVPAFMQFSDGLNFVADGVGRLIYNAYKNKANIYNDEIESWVSIYAELLKQVYDDLMIDSGIQFTFGTRLIAVHKDDKKNIAYAVCSAKSGIFAVKAKKYIDCTGDGDMAFMAGARYEKGDDVGNLMPGTLCSLWCHIDTKKSACPDNLPYNKYIEKAYKEGIFTILDRHLPGIWPVQDSIGGGNIGHCFDLDGTDETSITEALITSRKRLIEYETYFKKYLKGYEEMMLVSTGSLLGVRETRRIIGDYVLSLEDYKKKTTFDDEIGRYCYPVDIHASKPDKESHEKYYNEFNEELKYKKGESYGIPYRILTPEGLDNLLVAGRCVSTDRYVNGSIRVMPGCFITGQAAGLAAALTAVQNISVHELDIKELQTELKKLGAFLPNFNTKNTSRS